MIGGLLVVFGFYTHPSFMEQQFENIGISKTKTNFLHFNFNSEKKCEEYEAISPKLNDKYFDYIWNSAYQKFGEVVKSKDEIRAYYKQKKLFLVDSSKLYVVDSLFYSYAFLTKDAKILLEDIGAKFQEKLKHTTLSETRILVTSLLRTEYSVKRLRRRNRNSVRISSHLHGTTFDLAHNEFVAPKTLEAHEIDYLKEILALTLKELREENRCFVTYEYNQACFHVVNRNISLAHFENPSQEKTTNF